MKHIQESIIGRRNSSKYSDVIKHGIFEIRKINNPTQEDLFKIGNIIEFSDNICIVVEKDKAVFHPKFKSNSHNVYLVDFNGKGDMIIINKDITSPDFKAVYEVSPDVESRGVPGYGNFSGYDGLKFYIREVKELIKKYFP